MRASAAHFYNVGKYYILEVCEICMKELYYLFPLLFFISFDGKGGTSVLPVTILKTFSIFFFCGVWTYIFKLVMCY